MRVTRAYIASFGTAGSLVLCAAALFVLASALVTVKGWPTVATPGSPATQIVTVRAGGGSSAARRLAAPGLLGHTAAGPARSASAGAARRGRLTVGRKVVRTVGHTVAGAGSGAGHAVTRVTATALGGLSVTAGGAISGVGHAARGVGSTVSGVLGGV